MAAPTLSGNTTSGVEVLLSDGSVATVRAVLAEDLLGLLELHREAAERSRRMRFFVSGKSPAEQYAKHLVEAADRQLAVVATRAGEFLGVASAEAIANLRSGDPHEGEAEVAVFVADRWQHTGVGTLLLEHLAAAAQARGIVRLSAVVPTENGAIFDTFMLAGFDLQFERSGGGHVAVVLDLGGGRALLAAAMERERRSTAASIVPLLCPRSVVVVGASRRAGTAGHGVLGNLRARDFSGRLAAVNRHVVDGELICGVPAYRSVGQVPWSPDLAVIAVPAGEVAGVLEGCAAAGVGGVVVLSAGFAEAGNLDGELELVRIAHRHGIRLIGPDCLGVLNTDPAIRLDATLASATPQAGEYGGIGVGAQSGGLGIAVLQAAWERGLGLSSFVSLGNKADVSGNDLLLYWADDKRTQVIALSLQSIGNPQRFRRIATAISRTKPILVLGAGHPPVGASSGGSLTQAAATPDAVARALLRDAGVIKVDTTQELADVAALLAVQPVPAGRRVVIVGNAGGLGALGADAAIAAGAQVAPLSPATVALLQAAVGDVPALVNPIDLGAAATAMQYVAVLDVVVGGGEADAVVVVHVPSSASGAASVIAAVDLAEQESRKDQRTRSIAWAGALIGARPPRGGRLPWYASVESAANALARAGELGSWRAHGPVSGVGGEEPAIPTGIDVDAVRNLIESAACSPDGWLAGPEVIRLLELIGVPTGPTDGLELASDGVRPGLELLVGLAAPLSAPPAPSALPVVLVAAGGIHHEVYADQVFGTLPLPPGGPAAMVARLRSAPLLDGHRGSSVLDRQALIDVLERIAALDTIAPRIRELDLNPLVVTEKGVTAVEARVRISVAE